MVMRSIIIKGYSFLIGVVLRSLLFLWVLLLSSTAYAADLQQLLQLIDYIGIDYAAAVAQGEVINQSEYEEMQDFAQGVAQKIDDLGPGEHKTRLLDQSQQLITLIEAKADAVAIRAVTADMRLSIISNYKVTVIPRKSHSWSEARISINSTVPAVMVPAAMARGC
mgnify:CR=1 FL=1